MSQKVCQNRLYAGAARRCITPGPEIFPLTHFQSRGTGNMSVFSGKVLQDIYVRALIVENGENRAVIVVLDLPGVPEWKRYVDLISQIAGVSPNNVILTCTHNHSGPYVDNPIFEKFFGDDFTKKKKIYLNSLEKEIINVVKEAVQSICPVRMGYGKGDCYLNVYRREQTPNSSSVTYGFMPGVPVDRDLSLVRFDRLDGTPVAFLINYSVHACMMIHNNPEGTGTEISGDLPGYSCRMLEQSYDDQAVAMFTSGAAGDVNPLMMARFNRINSDGTVTVTDSGAGGPTILAFMGEQFHKDICKVNRSITDITGSAVIWCGRETAVFPGTLGIGAPPDRNMEFNFSLVMIGNTAIASTNGEIANQIGKRLKEASPYKKTFLVTHTGPWTGYILDDSGDGEVETVMKQKILGMMDRYAAGMMDAE